MFEINLKMGYDCSKCYSAADEMQHELIDGKISRPESITNKFIDSKDGDSS